MESRKKHFALVAWLGGLALATTPAFADVALNPGTQVVNPGAAGTAYTTTLPSWVNAGNLIDTLVANMTQDFVGTVTSRVYWIDAAHTKVGFTYVYHVVSATNPQSGTPTALDSSSFSEAGFAAFQITDAGADGSGSSHPVGSPALSNGDPLSIRRFADGHPKINWDGFDGTAIQAGDTSSVIFFATDAPTYFVSLTNLADSGAIGTAAVFAPIPEPTAVVLGLIGLAPLAWRRRMA